MNKTVKTTWMSLLSTEFEQEYFSLIEEFIEGQKATGKTIYPNEEDIFNAFRYTHFENTKVVLLGQDPYHGVKQAMGLSFSVPSDQKIPPSLKNIYKELQADLGYPIAEHGNLSSWAQQGILLLNAILTVNKKEPSSHKKANWENFTDNVIKQISKQRKNMVFILWGKFAQKKIGLIDSNKHLILTAAHPSPFSAHRGFFGCRHFSKTNAYLKKNGIAEINWQIRNQKHQLKLF